MAVAVGQITIASVLDGSRTEFQYAAGASPLVAPSSGWAYGMPAPQAGQYIWRIERTVHADGASGPWGDALRLTGEMGPRGNPGTLGVNTDLAVISVAGFDDDGAFGAATAVVHIGSSALTLNATQYTVAQDGYGYILGSASTLIQFARLRSESDGSTGSRRMAWREFNTGSEIVADAVVGQFRVAGLRVAMAEMMPPRSTGQFLGTAFMEILRNASDDDDTELAEMAMALGADRIFQTIVAIDAFIRNLWVSRLESESYAEDGNGFPDSGFHLDGISGIAKIANLISKNADINGTFSSDGFRTLPKVAGASVSTATVPKTIYRYSDMCGLLSSDDGLQVASGTIEGYAFTKASRRVNQRVLLGQTGSTTIAVGAGQEHILSRIIPSKLFGCNFFCEWHVDYTGNVSGRLYLRTKPGQTAAEVSSEWWYDADESDNTNYVNQSDMTLKTYHNSGSYSGSYALTAQRPDATVFVYSNALWGSVDATSNYHKVWTDQTFNGLVLTFDDATYRIVGYQPDAYYLASAKPFSVGAVNQDSASMRQYASGTDFYNLFGALAVGTNSAASGVVNVDGTSHAITRLRKDADKMVFFTGSAEVPVYKFVNGTGVGAYSDLQITTQIVVGAMDGGIESMWMIPWAGSSGVYDIGATTKKFRSLFLSSELHSASVQTGSLSAASASVGTINAQGTTNKVWGAVFN
jgi:hypothetical protein